MKHLLLALFIGLTAMGCRDRNEPQDQLPPITQHGANTFGAILNGKTLIPKGGIDYSWPPGGQRFGPARYFYYDNYEEISCSDYQTKKGYINIHLGYKEDVVYPMKIGTYSFEDAQDWEIEEKKIVIRAIVNNITYLSIANTGNITLTRNDNEVISGTFSCKLKNMNNPNDIIEIRNGRFDYNKKTINKTSFIKY